MDWQKWLNAMMGISTPEVPRISSYGGPTGYGGTPVALGGSGAHPSQQKFYSQEVQQQFSTAQADHATAMDQMKEDAQEHLRSWVDDYPAAGTAGQARKAPEAISMGPLAPANEMALYGRPQAFPGITSITNLKRRRA